MFLWGFVGGFSLKEKIFSIKFSVNFSKKFLKNFSIALLGQIQDKN